MIKHQNKISVKHVPLSKEGNLNLEKGMKLSQYFKKFCGFRTIRSTLLDRLKKNL